MSIRVRSRCASGHCAAEGVEHAQQRKNPKALEKMTNFDMEHPQVKFLLLFFVILALAMVLAYHQKCTECNPVGRPIPDELPEGLAPADQSVTL